MGGKCKDIIMEIPKPSNVSDERWKVAMDIFMESVAKCSKFGEDVGDLLLRINLSGCNMGRRLQELTWVPANAAVIEITEVIWTEGVGYSARINLLKDYDDLSRLSIKPRYAKVSPKTERAQEIVIITMDLKIER